MIETKKWALVWAGPIAADELDELFPNMSERYPRTLENLLMDNPDSFEQVNPEEHQHLLDRDYISVGGTTPTTLPTSKNSSNARGRGRARMPLSPPSRASRSIPR